jgi:putative radical SAM enzyme (TIGR03279 family)
MAVRITEICGTSGFFRKGDRIKAVDGRRVEDQLDLYYILSGMKSARFSIEREDGRKSERKIRIETFEKAAPVFEEMRFIHCASRCIFCFVDQMPPGMRAPLYFKDDDYRLSFLFGNYITLNDIKRKQIRKIVEYGLSPMYVSVHATAKKMRERIFGRPMNNDIMRSLSELAEGGITIHAQIVVIPGVNDGKVLEKTTRDLFRLYPACASLAIVPVGLTGHRKGLTELRKITSSEAREMIDLIAGMNSRFHRKTGGYDFAFLSDEFYLLAGRTLPAAETYGGFVQLSNGVGMARLFIDGIMERIEELSKRRHGPSGKMTVVTGRLGARMLKKYIMSLLEQKLPRLRVDLLTVSNSTFGRSVTVSGLLSGNDIRTAAKRVGLTQGLLVLPPNMVNHNGLMIDDMKPASLGRELGMRVVVPEEDFLEDRVLRAAGRRQQ